MNNLICYCDTGSVYENCCGIYHKNYLAPSALALMRSRYSAYVLHNADYILNTTHTSERKYYTKEAILQWSKSSKWQGLEIIAYSDEIVEFKAFYKDENFHDQIHHEISNFKKVNEKWFYVDGSFGND